jgi:hypothetical protein
LTGVVTVAAVLWLCLFRQEKLRPSPGPDPPHRGHIVKTTVVGDEPLQLWRSPERL